MQITAKTTLRRSDAAVVPDGPYRTRHRDTNNARPSPTPAKVDEESNNAAPEKDAVRTWDLAGDVSANLSPPLSAGASPIGPLLPAMLVVATPERDSDDCSVEKERGEEEPAKRSRARLVACHADRRENDGDQQDGYRDSRQVDALEADPVHSAEVVDLGLDPGWYLDVKNFVVDVRM